MKKGYWIGLIGLIALLLIISVSLTYKSKKESTTNLFQDSNFRKCLNLSEPVAVSMCMMYYKKGEAIQKITKEDCESLGSEYERDRCFYLISIGKNDSSPCEVIGNITIKDWCFYSTVIFPLNSLICERIQTSAIKDLCYTEVGAEASNLSECDKIQEQTSKEWCYSLNIDKTKDISFCNFFILQDYKRDCYSDIAVYSRNSSICDKILSAEGDSMDVLFCYKNVAKVSGDVSICDKILSVGGETFDVEECKEEASPAKKQDNIKSCDTIASYYPSTPEANYKDLCLVGMAMDYKDAKICDLIKDSETKTLCLRRV